MLWVQLVEIIYTKASRGAPAAGLRNQLPRGFAGVVPGRAYAFELYRLREAEGFAPRLEARRDDDEIPCRQEDLTIEVEGEDVFLGLLWNAFLGQPRRSDRPRALRLRQGDVARLMTNGRYASYSGQTYTEATYNVARGERLRGDVFTVEQVRKVLDIRADLF